MELNIDKSQWVKVQFGDVVQKVSNKIDPETYHSEIVLQGGHINKRDFHIREYENKNELGYLGPAFHMGFKKHQILYVSRNPHLMKVGYPNFDGICANTTFIMETKDESVLRNDLIPFIMHSDTFIEQSVANVRGGVNPYVNWSDLACIEFLLPPKDQQAQLAKLLWAMDAVIEKEIQLLQELDNTYYNLVDNLFSKKNEEWSFVRLGKISSINSDSLNSKTDPNYEFKYLDLASIVEPKVIGELKKMKYCEAPSRAKRIVADNSIVLAMVRPYQRAFAFVKNGNDIIASTGTAVINMNDSNLNRLVFHQFFSKRFTRYCEDRMTGTSYPAITPKDVDEYKVSIPKDLSLVAIESKKLDQLEKSSKSVRSKVESSKALQKSLINQVF